jgi:hypothetical protein
MIGVSFPGAGWTAGAAVWSVKKVLRSCNDQNIVRATDIQWIVVPPRWRIGIIFAVEELWKNRRVRAE